MDWLGILAAFMAGVGFGGLPLWLWFRWRDRLPPQARVSNEQLSLDPALRKKRTMWS